MSSNKSSNNKSTWVRGLLIVAALGLSWGCGSGSDNDDNSGNNADQADKPGDDDGTGTGSGNDNENPGRLMVRGTIVHDKTAPNTSTADFQWSPRSVVTVTPQNCQNTADLTDCYLMAERRYYGRRSLPMNFELYRKRDKRNCQDDPQRVCLLSVNMKAQGGDTNKVGDLITEERIEVPETPATGLTIQATGLESCQDPNAGGFCI